MNFDGALCAQTDPELWFPDRGGDPGPAKSLCAGCPLTAKCLEWALVHEEGKWGVWGGTTVQERRALRKERGLKTDTPAYRLRRKVEVRLMWAWDARQIAEDLGLSDGQVAQIIYRLRTAA